MEEIRLVQLWHMVHKGSAHFTRIYNVHVYMYTMLDCIYFCINVQSGQTALYIASKNGHVAIVNFLLQDMQADVRICQKVWKSDSPCVDLVQCILRI